MTDPAALTSQPPPGPDDPAGPGERDAGGPARRNAAVVSATTLVVSAANYVFALVLIRLLAAPDYVAYASVQSILLVLGSGGMAAIPWAVARHVAVHRAAAAAGEALGFGVLASVVQGLAFAGVTFGVVASASGIALAGVAALGAFALSVVVAPLGLLQGEGRFPAISGLRLLETAVRIGVSILLIVTVAANPFAPITGFIAGSGVLFAAAMAACRGAFPLRRPTRGVLGDLLRHSALLGAAQLALAALATADTVVIASTHLAADVARDYQVAALLGRVPVFLGTAIAMTYYPRIAAASRDAGRRLLADAARLVLLLAVPVAAVTMSAPGWMLEIVNPGRAHQVSDLLPFTTASGVAAAIATVIACGHQARERYRRILILLVPLVCAQVLALALAGDLGPVTGYAIVAAAIAVAAAALLTVDLRGLRPWSAIRITDGCGLLAVLVLGAIAREIAWVWWLAAAAAAVTVGLALLRKPAASTAR